MVYTIEGCNWKYNLIKIIIKKSIGIKSKRWKKQRKTKLKENSNSMTNLK